MTRPAIRTWLPVLLWVAATLFVRDLPLPSAARATFALAALVLPGVAWTRAFVPTGLPGSLAIGFVASYLVAALLGLTACLLHVPFVAFYSAFITIGAALIAWATRRTPPMARAPSELPIWLLGSIAAALMCFSPMLNGDATNHIARMTAFLQYDTLGFQSIVFGDEGTIPPRYWLAMWPLVKALASYVAGVAPIEMMAIYLPPAVGVVAFSSITFLGECLLGSRRVGLVSAYLHLAALLLLGDLLQTGEAFMTRVAEDKMMVAFVLAPAFFALLVRALATPTRVRMALAAGAYLAITVTHPTSCGITFLVCAAFVAMEALVRRAPLGIGPLLAFVLVTTAGVASLRFAPHPSQGMWRFSADDDPEAGDVPVVRPQAGKITTIPGTRFYGAARISTPLAFLGWIGLVLMAAVLQLRRNVAAGYAAAATLICGLAVMPYTGWLLGLLLTPFHLWRVLFWAPLGVGTIVLASVSLKPHRIHTLAGPAAFLVAACLVYVLDLRPPDVLALPNHWRESIARRLAKQAPDCDLRYDELEEMGAVLESLPDLGKHKIVGDKGINDFLPGIAAHAHLLTHRYPAQEVLMGAASYTDAEERDILAHQLWAGELSSVDAAKSLLANDVGLVLICANSSWFKTIPMAFLSRELLAQRGPLQLYSLSKPSVAEEAP